MKPRLVLFLAALVLSYAVLLFKHGPSSVLVGAIGLITYFFPILAMVAGFNFIRSKSDLTTFMTVYSVIVAPFLVGGLLQYLGWFPDSRIIGTDVLGMQWFRQWPGHIVWLNSGFSRSPDVMGWHAALLVMFSLVLLITTRSKIAKISWLGIALWGSIILLISGRNKMIFMPFIFVAVFGLCYLYKGRMAKIISVGLAVSALAVFFVLLNNQMKLDQEYLRYMGEGSATASERVAEQGIGGILVTIQQSGVLGEGLGSASTGARFGGAAGIRTWQEAGLPKIVVELGVFGLVAFLLLGMTLVLVLFQSLNSISAGSPVMPFFAGMLGILAANGASFMVSHQIFGDPFIVTLTGFFLGIALSFVRWQNSRVRTGLEESV